MANSLNEIKLIGNLGRDPVVSATPAGVAVVALSIGTTHSWKVEDKWEEETEWHRVVFFGPKAESISKRFRKGDKVYVSGRIKTKTWNDPNGVEKTIKEIVGADYVPMGNPNKESLPQQPRAQQAQSTQQARPAQQRPAQHAAPNAPQAQPQQIQGQNYDPFDEGLNGQQDYASSQDPMF